MAAMNSPIRVAAGLILTLFLMSAISPLAGVVESAQSEDDSEQSGGRVIAALVMPLGGQSGNSSEAVFAPHLVELHTATWCVPCRTAEREVGELGQWWPAVLAISHHSSVNSPDELATEQSAGLKEYYGFDGYPTLLVDGYWTLRGETQSVDLQDLLTNLSQTGLQDSAPELNLSWQRVGSGVSANWTYSADGAHTLDLLVVHDGVDWPNTAVTLDGIVTGGVTNLSMNGTAEFEVNSTGGNPRLVAIIRVAGEPVTEPGTETPFSGTLQNSWSPPSESRTLSGKTIFTITLVLVGLALIPMRHTLPVLWRKKTPISTTLEEE